MSRQLSLHPGAELVEANYIERGAVLGARA